MKRLVNIYLIVVFSLVFTSCNDWLDGVKQTSTVTDDVIWEEEESVEKYINSLYTLLHKYGQFGDTQFGGSLTESLTETFKYGSYAIGARAGIPNNYVVDPNAISDESCSYSIWAGVSGSAYEHIRLVNQFLELQKKYSKFSDDKNKLWEAQARFFRAYVYFQLAKRHGGVILYDGLPKPGGKNRSSKEETWQFIADDLDFAAKYLPIEWPSNQRGKLARGAAYGLKSRAMLYAERWQDAYDAAEAVINLNLYGLTDKYEDSWKGNNKEAVLEFFYDKNTGPNHSFDQYYVPQCDGYDNGGTGSPTQEMVEAYETVDGKKVDWSPWHSSTNITPPYEKLEPRFKSTIIYRGCTWKNKVMDCSVDGENGVFMAYREQVYTNGKTTTGYFLRKLMDENLTDVKNVKSSQTWVEIRYAEILLNKAEAAYRLNNVGEAQNAMNQVRSRKELDLPEKTSVGEEWFKDYRNERKVELSYEGHLFWDMRRWRLAHKEYSNYRVHGVKITGSSNTYQYVDCDGQDRQFTVKQYVLPIPSAELKNNPMIEQYDEWK